MRTSDGINELAAAMAAAQADIQPAVKDAVNPAFRSKYADLSAIWGAIRGPLSKHKIAVWQEAELNEAGVAVTTRLAHSSGQWIEFGPLTVPCAKRDAHGVGSATTYAKRYAIAAAVGVVSDEDDDGNAAVQPKSAGVVVDAPAMPDVDVPPGAVLIKRVEQFKATTGKTYWTVTDHKNITYKEWDQRRASVLEQYAQNRVPVILTVKETKWGRDISSVVTADREIQREPHHANEPPLTDEELAMPF